MEADTILVSNMADRMYSAPTLKGLKTLSREHGDIQILAQLDEKELNSSGSRWKFRHLIVLNTMIQESWRDCKSRALIGCEICQRWTAVSSHNNTK